MTVHDIQYFFIEKFWNRSLVPMPCDSPTFQKHNVVKESNVRALLKLFPVNLTEYYNEITAGRCNVLAIQ